MSPCTYSRTQIETYLDHISFPQTLHPFLTSEVTRSAAGIEYISVLQRYHLATVPFENISLHYSKDKVLSLDNEDLYSKIVGRTRGGYCMENNQFFGTILRSLGYEVVSVGARVCGPDGNYGGWDHQISLVVVEESIYLVDVGFGGRCPTRPILLSENQAETYGSALGSHRLILEKPSNPILHNLWVLQHRSSSSHEFKPVYSFGLTEFHPRDFEVMNYATSTLKDSIFTQKIIVVKFLLGEDSSDVIGMVSLEGVKFKRRIGDETPKVRVCENERERIEELREWFEIELSEEEVRGIKGTDTELKEDSLVQRKFMSMYCTDFNPRVVIW